MLLSTGVEFFDCFESEEVQPETDSDSYTDRLSMALPAEVVNPKQYLLWREEQTQEAGKKPLKVPYYARGVKRNGTQGSPEDRAQLVTFADAVRVYDSNPGRYSGVGIAMLPEAGLIGVDLDDCIVDGKIDPKRAHLIEGTYAEISPSGNGVRAFYTGSYADCKDIEAGVEIFHRTGFLTLTGNRLNGNGTPARTLTDVYGAVDPEENIYRDYRQSPMILPIAMNIPKISQMAPESASPLRTGKPVKAESVGGVPGGLLRQVTGLSVKVKNEVEQEVDRIGLPYTAVAPRTGDPEANRIMARHMAPMVEAAAPKLIGSETYERMPAEMKRFAMSALFTDIKKKAFIKLGVTHPYAALRVQYERLNDDVAKMVEGRVPGIRAMLESGGAAANPAEY